MAKSSLKKEWDKNKGKMERVCRVCKQKFTPTAWNQTLCKNDFCKQGSFRKAHLEASKRRWESWQKEAKKKGIDFN